MSVDDVLRNGRPDLQPWIDTGTLKEVTEGEGTGLVGDHDAGATTLTVAAGGFREAGQCQVGEDVYDYTRDGDSLSIDPPLVADAEDGEPVLSLTPDGKVETALVAVLDLDGTGDPDDYVRATISGDLAGFYPLGLGAAGAIVRVEDTTYGYRVAGRPLDAPWLSAEVLDPDTGPPGLPSLADQYAYANANAAAAAAAATTATTALTAANGKNKVTYSLSTPGSTANTAGDIWFQKEAATQTIIGQWEGLGGTSWSQKTLNDAVIANLDAGKLVAGSAFVNGLWVKTNFTLGDAAVNGVIQSHNFAGSPVGVYIDKFGLVAKGGAIAGAEITGGEIYGAYIEGATIYGAGSVSGDHVESFGNVVASDVVAGNSIHSVSTGSGIYDDSLNGGGTTDAVIGNEGRIRRPTSSQRFKTDITDLDVDADAVLAVRPRRFRWIPPEGEEPDLKEYAGVIAEEVDAIEGLGHFVYRDADGLVAGFHYSAFTVALLTVCQRQQQQIDDLTARLDAAGL